MSLDDADQLCDAQVRAARERGEFDHLPGHGKPLVLDDLDHLPAAQRFEALLLRNAGEVSATVSLVREIRALRAQIQHSSSEQEQARAREVIREKKSELQRLLKSGG
jgi:hypothetical protein